MKIIIKKLFSLIFCNFESSNFATNSTSPPVRFQFLTLKDPITPLEAPNSIASNLRASRSLFRTAIFFGSPLGSTLSNKMIVAELGVTLRLQDYDRRSAWSLFTCESCPVSCVICCYCCCRHCRLSSRRLSAENSMTCSPGEF